MADFSKKRKSLIGLHGKRGAPTKGAKKRDNPFVIKFSTEELDLMDELVVILDKRRNIGSSRPDLLAYLIERAYEKEQDSKPFTPFIKRGPDGKRI